MIKFTNIVSLGYRCRTTRRLREHFGVSLAFPLDWWVTPLKGAVRFLRDWDLERLYDPQHLIEIADDDRIGYVENKLYGIKFYHEFPRGEGKLGVLPGWREHLDHARSRTRFLMDRLDQLNRPDRRILIVRELAPDEQQSLQQCIHLKQAVRGRLPLARCVFLLVSADGVAARGWHGLKVDDPSIEPWWGEPLIWDRALASLEFRIAGAFHGPPEDDDIDAVS